MRLLYHKLVYLSWVSKICKVSYFSNYIWLNLSILFGLQDIGDCFTIPRKSYHGEFVSVEEHFIHSSKCIRFDKDCGNVIHLSSMFIKLNSKLFIADNICISLNYRLLLVLICLNFKITFTNFHVLVVYWNHISMVYRFRFNCI